MTFEYMTFNIICDKIEMFAKSTSTALEKIHFK